jgi:hypothetical protein
LCTIWRVAADADRDCVRYRSPVWVGEMGGSGGGAKRARAARGEPAVLPARLQPTARARALDSRHYRMRSKHRVCLHRWRRGQAPRRRSAGTEQNTGAQAPAAQGRARWPWLGSLGNGSGRNDQSRAWGDLLLRWRLGPEKSAATLTGPRQARDGRSGNRPGAQSGSHTAHPAHNTR